ncbi:MAG: ligase 1 protein [Candidatus Nomurabacteria bacterium GW2011_GWA2_43_15]|uniref:Ligase 1 protein n=3 Tax=Candidatus Nomuraibacteriota TaxID=1752729 RepID=A0A0G1GNY7_9BACT|nr:MAG: ligase 1 protein [Candidatus Nomurabacteria bacterium GW2011_GWA2_43_15]KKT19402.1 MAG: ligase 1 protein [Candidatus Nomurabacteria bacterium GW2011_GWB1_43_7]
MKENIPTTIEKGVEPLSKLKALKEKVRELNDRYKSEIQREEKAILYSQLEKTRKEYEKLEEELDSRPKMSEQETKFAKLKALKIKIKELDDRWKSEMQKEDKAALWNQLEKAKKEYLALEEELDKASGKKEEKEKTSDTSEDKTKKIEEKEGIVLIFIDLLEKAKGGDEEAVKILIEFVTTHKIEITIKSESTPEEKKAGEILIVLLEKLRSGDITVIDQLIQIVNVNINIITIIEITPPVQPPRPPTPPRTPEPVPQTLESRQSLDELRDSYLKAKRLRGNVFRGKFGRLFRRKLSFGTEEMDFGGKKGAEDLEEVREEYQKKLAEYRAGELATLQASLEARFLAGTVTPAQIKAEIQGKIVNLLSEEQNNIDTQSVRGIEKNLFEKMKTKWRQFGKTRLVAGLLLGGAAAATGGTAIGVGLVGVRAGMGAVGTYVGVEAGLERYSKLVGHKGLINKIGKAGHFITEESLYRHILTLSDEDVKKEAARLRMLQVEKGVSIDNISNDGRIALAILRRDNELAAEETVNTASLDPAARLADRLSNRLAIEVNSRNEVIESEVDRERIKKMLRKTTAVLAGGAVGWLIGGKLFHKPEVDVPSPHAPPLAPSHVIGGEPITPSHIPHIVTPGENTWKIIEANLDSRNTMAGLIEGTRTHMIDALKDMFDKMSPEELKHIGFSSGDADLLYVGDSLNMSDVLDNPGIITRALFNASNISPEQIASIVKNNTKIAHWLAEHRHELKGVFDSAMIEKVLRGTI